MSGVCIDGLTRSARWKRQEKKNLAALEQKTADMGAFERAKAVEFLKSIGAQNSAPALFKIAEAIERGDHLK